MEIRKDMRIGLVEAIERAPILSVPVDALETLPHKENSSLMIFSSQVQNWVYFEAQTEQVLKRNYDEVFPPVFAEVVPTLKCPCDCGGGLCSFAWQKSIHRVSERGLEPDIHSDLATLRLITRRLADAGVKMLLYTGGGEPMMNSHTVDAMRYAREKELQVALYTNGIPMNPHRISELVETEPVFVRFSINAGTAEVHQQFMRPKIPNAFQRVLRNIELMAKEKLRQKSPMVISLAVIFNDQNVDNLPEVAKRAREINERVGGQAIEYIQIRPIINFRSKGEQLERRILERAEEKFEEVNEALEGTGINAGVLKYRFDEVLYDTRDYDKCRGNAWTTDVGPDGRVYLCCAKNLNPAFCIGDLREQSLEEIWRSEQRASVINKVNATKCSCCPRTCTRHYMNRVFARVDAALEDGRTEEVRAWIEYQRQKTKTKWVWMV